MAKPWFPFYARDYLADTRHLSLAEHGAYLLLMTAYYNTGGKLPANELQMQKICMAVAADEQAAVVQVLNEFFELRDGFYHHARIDIELEKQQAISEKRSAAARKRYTKASNGGSKTATKAEANEGAFASTTTATGDNPFGVSGGGGGKGASARDGGEVAPRPDAAVRTAAGEKWGTEEDLFLARHIWRCVQPISGQRKEPSWPDWANTLRLARERDGVTTRELREAFDWANADRSFWQANILSPEALRRQLPKLTAQMRRGSVVTAGGRMTFDQLMGRHDDGGGAPGERACLDEDIIEGEVTDA